jgi:hypothetical protein
VANHFGTQKTQECELPKRRIMADTETTEAPGLTGAETQTQSITTLEELTASFVDKVDGSEAKEESEVEVSPEATTADAETDQDDVLSQLTESEESEEEETEAEEEESTDELGDAEPQSKAVGKLLKQVNRLTARAKAGDELVDTLKSEIASLKSSPQKSSQPALEEVHDFQSLETLRKEALAAKRWSLQHIGKDYVEVDGKEYADEDIRNILTQAEDYLTEKIPERAQYLQSKSQWQQDTINTHPWISDKVDTDIAEERRSVLGQIKSQYADILKSLPNGDFVAATLVRGVEAIKQDQAAKTAKLKAKRIAKAPPPTMGDSSPPVQTSVSENCEQTSNLGA